MALGAELIITLAGKAAGAAASAAGDKAMHEFLIAVGLEEEQPDFDAYFDKVHEDLGRIKDQLNDIQRAVEAVRDQQTELKFAVDDAELTTLLHGYARDANLITQRFETYNSAVTALAEDDADSRRRGAELMLKVLRTESIEPVGAAMLNVRTAFLGDGPSLPGIYDFLVRRAEERLESAVIDAVDAGRAAHDGPLGRPFIDSLKIFEPYPAVYVDVAAHEIYPRFRAVLATLAKGIVLLESAYGQTIQRRQLDRHDATVREISDRIARFWNELTAPMTAQSRLQLLWNKYRANPSPALRDLIWAENVIIFADAPRRADHPFPTSFANHVTVRGSVGGRDQWLLVAPDIDWGAPNQCVLLEEHRVDGTGYVAWQRAKAQLAGPSSHAVAVEPPSALAELVTGLEERVLAEAPVPTG